jgi:hypothetical protein
MKRGWRLNVIKKNDEYDSVSIDTYGAQKRITDEIKMVLKNKYK